MKIGALLSLPPAFLPASPACDPAGPVDSCQLSRPVGADPQIPDARAILADPSLRYVDLNRSINRSYAQFGRLMQEVVDPLFDGGSSQASPSWYGMAVYASRMAGRSMQAADQALSVVKQMEAGKSFACAVGSRAEGVDLEGLGLWGTVKLCAAFLTALFLGQQEPGTRASAWFDPRTITVAAHRLAGVIREDSGPVVDRLARVAQTLQNALEDGNRRIFADIGVAGQQFMEARRAKGAALTEGEVLAMAPEPEQARAVLEQSRQVIEQGGPLPTSTNTANMLWAAFALYEEAGKSPPGRRDPAIQLANELMAYHEQFTVAVPAFEPPAPIPGELDRPALFSVVTPSVCVPTREGTWRYSRFASRELPPRDSNPMTPRVTEYNWARFEDRWPGILDFFGERYHRPEQSWPMPPAEPSAPL
ncbi:MAG: hypothetical protein AMXMBFR33_65320 [Candidatus Xenobia bacterium]